MVSKGGVINFPNLNQHCVTFATVPVAEGHYCYCDAWIVIWELIFVRAKKMTQLYWIYMFKKDRKQEVYPCRPQPVRTPPLPSPPPLHLKSYMYTNIEIYFFMVSQALHDFKSSIILEIINGNRCLTDC